jgi:hypothetical protein
MGLRFDLRIANWLAHVLDERMPVPVLGDPHEEKLAIQLFINSLKGKFYSSPRRIDRFHDLIHTLDERLDSQSSRQILETLRSFLGHRPWTALLVPSGMDRSIDDMLCSQDFLRTLVDIRTEDPGLILQLDDPPSRIFSLTDVFPAFKTALAASTEWPGVLLWTRDGDSVFLPLGDDPCAIEDRAHWIFSHLGTSLGVDVGLLKSQFMREFPDMPRRESSRVTVVQLSDVHLGSKEANLRIPRVQDLVHNLVTDLANSGETVIPMISGDLMDSPDEDNLDRVRAFLGFLANLGTEPPVVLLGNHDVRRDGYLSENLRMAMQITERSGAVRWFDDFKFAIACFDSVRDGKLARGSIGERQFLDMGSKLDLKCRNMNDYVVVAALHHHPIPVEIPEWYARPFYERILGNTYEKTEELEDGRAFVDFVQARRFAAVLHGHKHIPRLDSTDQGIPVIGCGSSVGKVKTHEAGTFMSINLITLNTKTRNLSARLMAERVAGGGLGQYKSHEIVWSPQRAPNYTPGAQASNS